MIRRARSHDGVLDHLRETMEADRSVIAQPKRLLRTWKNSVEREVIADSRKEFALAFALTFARKSGCLVRAATGRDAPNSAQRQCHGLFLATTSSDDLSSAHPRVPTAPTPASTDSGNTDSGQNRLRQAPPGTVKHREKDVSQ